MIGKNVQKWLNEIICGESRIRLKAAENLLKTSEYYFDDKKVPPAEREEILNQIESAMNDEESLVRLSVLHIAAILKVWNQTTRKLIGTGLKDINEEVLASAVYTSGAFKFEADSLVDELMVHAEHPNREVRWRVPWSLSQIKRCPDERKSMLIGLIRDNDHLVRMQAFEAISACFDEADRQIHKAVVKGLKDKDESVRAASCRAIAELEGNWRWVKGKLKSMVKNEVHGIQAEAILALCKHWPSCVSEKRIKNWLEENTGYWWAQDLLNGKKIKM